MFFLTKIIKQIRLNLKKNYELGVVTAYTVMEEFATFRLVVSFAASIQSSSHAGTLPLNTEQTQVASNVRTSFDFSLSRGLEVLRNYMTFQCHSFIIIIIIIIIISLNAKFRETSIPYA